MLEAGFAASGIVSGAETAVVQAEIAALNEVPYGAGESAKGTPSAAGQGCSELRQP